MTTPSHRGRRRRGWSLVFASLALVLLPSSFILSAEDAAEIARNALRAAPPGDWTLSAVLSTTVKASGEQPRDAKSVVTPGERVLTIRFRRRDRGAREVAYRMKNGEGKDEGVRMIYGRDPARDGIRLLALSGDDPVKDPRLQLFGSAFTCDDLALRFLAWPDPRFLGEESLKDRPCWKIACAPPRGDAGPYARVECWVDREYKAPLKAVAYDAAGVAVKVFQVRSFQQIEGAWMLKHLDLDAPKLQARSRLEILDARKDDDR